MKFQLPMIFRNSHSLGGFFETTMFKAAEKKQHLNYKSVVNLWAPLKPVFILLLYSIISPKNLSMKKFYPFVWFFS